MLLKLILGNHFPNQPDFGANFSKTPHYSPGMIFTALSSMMTAHKQNKMDNGTKAALNILAGVVMGISIGLLIGNEEFAEMIKENIDKFVDRLKDMLTKDSKAINVVLRKVA